MSDLTAYIDKVVPTGIRYVAYITKTKKGNYVSHKIFRQTDKLADFVREKDAEGVDTYIAMCSFKEALVEKPNGKKAPSRKRANASTLKSFYIDVDCKDSKYNDKRDILRDILTNVSEKKLPEPSIIVDSGNGCHFYWTLNEPISMEDWVPIATQFKMYLGTIGVEADPTVTADAVRILRPPETRNHKDPDNPHTVRVLKSDGPSYDPDALAGSFTKVVLPPQLRGIDVEAFNADMDAGMGGQKGEFPPSYVEELLPHCQTLSKVMRTHGADLSYEQWRMSVQICAHAEDGEAYAHLMSKGHDDYDEHKTQELFEQAKEDKAGGQNAITCERFKAEFDGACDGCPMNVKSPIQLGEKREQPEVDPGNPESPYMFEIERHAVIYVVPPKKEGDKEKRVPILRCGFSNPVLLEEYSKDGIKSTIRTRVHTPTDTNPLGRMVDIDVVTLMQSSGTCSQHLAQRGILLSTAHQREIQIFMSSWAEQLKRAGKVRKMTLSGFGWGTLDGEDIFQYAGKLYLPDGTTVEAPVDSELELLGFGVKGDIERWKPVANKFLKDDTRSEMQVGMATPFAGPLMALFDEDVPVICFSSPETGIGKSMLLTAAMTVWGNPAKIKMNNNATENWVSSRLSKTPHLPVYWDEIQKGMADIQNNSRSGANFIRLLFSLTEGTGRGRSSLTGKMRESGHWSTLVVCGSNSRLSSAMTRSSHLDAAVMARILDIPFEDTKVLPGSVVRPMLAELQSNYGTAGEIYVKDIVANREQIKKDLHKAAAMIMAKWDLPPGARLLSNVVAAHIVGAKRAMALGLLDFDVPSMIGRLKRAVISEDEDVEKLEDFDPLDLVGQYMNEFAQWRVITDTRPQGAGRVHAGSIKVHYEPEHGQSAIYQYVIKDNMLLFDKAHFREWLGKRGHEIGYVLKNLNSRVGIDMDSKQLTIGSGTESARYRVRPISIDCSESSLASLTPTIKLSATGSDDD